MYTIVIQEFQQEISQILHRVYEQKETIGIINHGQIIAHLVPVIPPQPMDEKNAMAWAELDQLTAKIDKHWHFNTTAVDAVKEGRREL